VQKKNVNFLALLNVGNILTQHFNAKYRQFVALNIKVFKFMFIFLSVCCIVVNIKVKVILFYSVALENE